MIRDLETRQQRMKERFGRPNISARKTDPRPMIEALHHPSPERRRYRRVVREVAPPPMFMNCLNADCNKKFRPIDTSNGECGLCKARKKNAKKLVEMPVSCRVN